MTFEDILDTMRNPDFFPNYPKGDSVKLLPKDFIFDENQSVKWNRQRVQEHNELAQTIKKDYWNKMNEIDRWFSEQVQEAIQNEIHVSEKAASIIFNQAWEDGHSNGYHEVIHLKQGMKKMLSMVSPVIKAH